MSVQRELGDDFHLMSKIGQGGFGSVFFARNKFDDSFVAVKAMQKVKCSDFYSLQCVSMERKVLGELRGDFFFTQLVCAKDSASLYFFVLELCQGGDLSIMQSLVGEFCIDSVRFFLAELFIAVGHLHRLKIIHRDLKRQNLLIRSDGHLVVGDFGLACHLEGRSSSTTITGTPTCMAPEQLAGRKYSFGVDYWAIGIIAAELFGGRNPFLPYEIADWDIAQRICRNRIEYEEPQLLCSDEAATGLIKWCLAKSPDARPSFNDVRSCQFFQKFDWSQIEARTMCLTVNHSGPADLSRLRQQVLADISVVPYKGNAKVLDFEFAVVVHMRCHVTEVEELKATIVRLQLAAHDHDEALEAQAVLFEAKLREADFQRKRKSQMESEALVRAAVRSLELELAEERRNHQLELNDALARAQPIILDVDALQGGSPASEDLIDSQLLQIPLLTPLAVKSKSGNLSCGSCRRKFSSLSVLTRHCRLVHLGVRNYACLDCPLKFGSASNLRRHCRTVHLGEKECCVFCLKEFSSSYGLKRHATVCKKKLV